MHSRGSKETLHMELAARGIPQLLAAIWQAAGHTHNCMLLQLGQLSSPGWHLHLWVRNRLTDGLLCSTGQRFLRSCLWVPHLGSLPVQAGSGAHSGELLWLGHRKASTQRCHRVAPTIAPRSGDEWVGEDLCRHPDGCQLGGHWGIACSARWPHAAAHQHLSQLPP